MLSILLSLSKLLFICSENRRGENQIKFTGTSYLFLGGCQFQCHQGGDKISKKSKFRETQKEKLTGDHAKPIKTKNLTQPSKKVGCPATFAVKKIYSFPEYKILADTERQRTNASIKQNWEIFYLTYSNPVKKRSPEILRYLENYSTSHVFLQVGKISTLHERNYFPIAIRDCIH